MSHLAQFPSDPQVLPVIPQDEVLFLFKCESDEICDFWDADAGANAVFAVKKQDLAHAPTEPPQNAKGSPTVIPEFGITHWTEHDDGAPAALEQAFYDDDAHANLPDEIAWPHDGESVWRTKVGGVPYWTANGVQNPPPGRLLLQIDNWINVEGKDEEIANFCSDGTAFVFFEKSDGMNRYSLFINR